MTPSCGLLPLALRCDLIVCAQPAFPEDDEKDKEKDKEHEVSAEDKALLEGLELAVERAQDPDAGVQHLALEHLRSEIRAATSSMTSVPKPLKFLRPHYQTLKTVSTPAASPSD